jgi:hypothetical protein
MLKIGLLDPSLRDNSGNPSLNLGDCIIFESIYKQFQEMFPGAEIIRASSHSLLEKKQIQLFKKCHLNFIGGTNLLSSNAMAVRGMPLAVKKFIYLFPPVKNFVLMGVGWGFGYNEAVRLKTKIFYKRLLNNNIIHSCRDTYSADKLSHATFLKTINTCCPTTWNLKNAVNFRKNNFSDCLFTLTDYKSDPEKDSILINTIIGHFNKIIFFPQGSGDLEYLGSLDIYKRNRSKFKLLPYDYQTFKSLLQSDNHFTCLGTRLHTGIMCMQHGIDSLIIAVDNRALDMHKDTMLPVVQRMDNLSIIRWLNGEKIYPHMELPFENIKQWKKQFA